MLAKHVQQDFLWWCAVEGVLPVGVQPGLGLVWQYIKYVFVRAECNKYILVGAALGVHSIKQPRLVSLLLGMRWCC